MHTIQARTSCTPRTQCAYTRPNARYARTPYAHATLMREDRACVECVQACVRALRACVYIVHRVRSLDFVHRVRSLDFVHARAGRR